jgi:predicted DNA-binding transcriptional regulator AlpA
MSPAEFATLLADPARVPSIPRGEVPKVLGQLEELRAALWAHMTMPQRTSALDQAPAANAEGDTDRLLTVQELAKALSVDDRWVYRRADSLPFTRRLSDRTLRFSQRGLDRWLAGR